MKKNSLKKGLQVLLCAAMVTCCVVGCGQKSDEEGSVKKAETGGVLRYAMETAPSNIDPTNLFEITSYEMVRQCYNGLTDRTEDGQVIEGLAKSWDTEDNGKTWHFVLKEGVKFHSGEELTAEDVKYTFEKDLDPNTEGDGASFLENIEGAEAISKGEAKELSGFEVLGDYEFNVHFTTEEVLFPEYCSIECLYIVDQSVLENAEDGWWKTESAGTGPFEVTEYAEDEKVVMKANADYFDGAPSISEIDFTVVEDDSATFEMYKNGEFDVISAPWSELDNIKEDSELKDQLHEYTVADMTYLGMSQDLYEPFKDVRVREAISLVINQDDIADKIMAGTAVPLYGVIPVDFVGYNDKLEKPENNTEKAVELLKEAGYDEKNPLPETTLYYMAMDEDNAVYIADQLKKELNWEVKLENPDRSAYIDGLYEKKYGFFIMGNTADCGDVGTILGTFEKDAPRNFSNYDNKEFEDVMKKASTTADTDARIKLYQEAEKILMDDYACIGMYTDNSYMLVKPEVSGMKYSGLGMESMAKVEITK